MQLSSYSIAIDVTKDDDRQKVSVLKRVRRKVLLAHETK